MIRILTPALLLLTLSSFLYGDIRFSHLTLDEGLSNNSVYCITKDSEGFMWFGTFSGLNRYDGRDNRVFRPRSGEKNSINGSVVFSIFEDSTGRLWVGTDGGGLNLYNKETMDFGTFSNDPDDPLSLPGNQVFSLTEDNSGRLWVGTAGGGLALYREEGKFFILDTENSRLINNRIRTLYCDEEDRLWIGTEEGLSVYDTESGLFIDETIPGIEKLESEFIRSISYDRERGIWIGTKEGLYLYDNTGLSEFPLPSEIGVRTVVSDGEHLWVGTERSGLFIYDFTEQEWQVLNETNSSLSYNKIRSIYRDDSGLIWIGTRGGGINMFNPRTELITTWTSEDKKARALSSPYIRQMEERSDGSIWVATDGGSITVIDPLTGSTGKIALPEPPSPGNGPGESDQVYSLLEDSSGVMWIGTDGAGLYTIAPDENISRARPFSLQREGQGGETIWFVFESSDSSIWIGTEGLGLFRWKNGVMTGFTHDPGSSEGLNGNAVRCIFEDSRKRIWVGTWDGGLNLYDEDRDNFTGFARSPSLAGSLSDTSVNTIFEDKRGRIWVGTGGGGISIIRPDDSIFRNISTRNGLAGDNIYGLMDDDEGNIWASTDKGLSRISLIDEEIRNFSRGDGLAGNEFSQNAYLKTSSGRLFWGGNHGISAFYPGDLNFSTRPPGTIRFTGLWIHNLPVRIGQSISDRVILDRDIALTDAIRLPYESNNITIRFSILSYIDSSKHHYTARLAGLEQRARFLGNSNQVSYASLPPGSYELIITGTDNNGQRAEARLGVIIETPFWMHLWFYVVSTLLFLFMISLIILYRLKVLAKSNAQLRSFTMHMEKAREEERKAAARDYHDELGQQLTAMKFDLFWLNSHPESEEQVRREKITSLLEIVNDAISSVRTLSTNLRPKALDNLTLTEALEWQSRRFRKRTGIELDLDVQIRGRVFPEEDIDRKTALFRMYQEVLTNIIRHSETDRVTVKVYRADSRIYLSVRDNGIGISKKESRKDDSFGLIGMRERCRHFNGSFSIDNHPDGGTIVKITLPLQEENKR